MDKAGIIRPEFRKSKCRCTLCNLTYSPKEYKALYDIEKVIYFSYLPPEMKRPKTVCHSCLLTLIKSYRKTELKIEVKIIDNFEKSSWNCHTYANDIDDSVVDLSFFP